MIAMMSCLTFHLGILFNFTKLPHVPNLKSVAKMGTLEQKYVAAAAFGVNLVAAASAGVIGVVSAGVVGVVAAAILFIYLFIY